MVAMEMPNFLNDPAALTWDASRTAPPGRTGATGDRHHDRHSNGALRRHGPQGGAGRAGPDARPHQAPRLRSRRHGRLLPVARLPGGRRLLRHGVRDPRRPGPDPRLLPAGRGPAAAPDPARRHAGPPAERLDVHEPEWRL